MGISGDTQLHCLADSQSVRLVEICRALQTNPTWSAELVGKHWVTHRNLISIHIHSIVFTIYREKSHLENSIHIPQARKSNVTVNPKNGMLFVWPRYVLMQTPFSVFQHLSSLSIDLDNIPLLITGNRFCPRCL